MATGSHGQEVAQHGAERGLDFAARDRGTYVSGVRAFAVLVRAVGCSWLPICRFK